MKKLNKFVSESLLDDEDDLINSENLTDIPHTGIKYIDKKVDEMNSKLKAPIIYDRFEKMVENASMFLKEFNKDEISNLLPSEFIKGIDSIANAKLKSKENPLDIANEMDTFRSAINFIIKVQDSSIKSIKEFAKSKVFLNSTNLDKSSDPKYGKNNTVLSWEFYNSGKDIDFVNLEKDLKKLRASKGRSKIDFIITNASDSDTIDVTIDIIFYK